MPFDVYLHRRHPLLRPESLQAPMATTFDQLAASLGLDPMLLEDVPSPGQSRLGTIDQSASGG